MADVPYFELVVPIVASAAISAIFILGKKVTKSSDDIIESSLQLNHLKDKLEAGLKMAETTIAKSEQVHDELHERIDEVCKRVDKLDTEIRLICYRLERLDNNYNGNKRYDKNR